MCSEAARISEVMEMTSVGMTFAVCEVTASVEIESILIICF